MVGRELTKVHQEFLRGTASELATRFEASSRGEFTIVIGPMTNMVAAKRSLSDDAVSREFGLITERGGVSRRQAIVKTAKQLGISVNDVYSAVERHKLGDEPK
jgi:16S rRNA (cytidine1402-2'-O)-methyltransferase